MTERKKEQKKRQAEIATPTNVKHRKRREAHNNLNDQYPQKKSKWSKNTVKCSFEMAQSILRTHLLRIRLQRNKGQKKKKTELAKHGTIIRSTALKRIQCQPQ